MKTLKIKQEYLDLSVKCPLTRGFVVLRFLEESLYNYYFTHAYSEYFEEEIKSNPEIKTSYMTFPKISNITENSQNLI